MNINLAISRHLLRAGLILLLFLAAGLSNGRPTAAYDFELPQSFGIEWVDQDLFHFPAQVFPNTSTSPDAPNLTGVLPLFSFKYYLAQSNRQIELQYAYPQQIRYTFQTAKEHCHYLWVSSSSSISKAG